MHPALNFSTLSMRLATDFPAFRFMLLRAVVAAMNMCHEASGRAGYEAVPSPPPPPPRASGASADAAPPRLEKGSAEWAACESLWGFLRLGAPLPPRADGILCLCSHDVRVATHAAALFLAGRGGFLLFSGGFGTGPHSGARLNGWTEPEAVVFARVAAAAGVPADAILVEDQATNTGENISLSRRLLKAKGFPDPVSLILVQKPYMERRSVATFQRQWGDGPLPELFASSPPLSFEEYTAAADGAAGGGLPRETTVGVMVGDTQRLRVYAQPPARDFQAPVAVPDAVWAAYELLVRRGYTMNVLFGPDDAPLA